MTDKLCPLQSTLTGTIECTKEECQWWICKLYVVDEGVSSYEWDCSINHIARGGS